MTPDEYRDYLAWRKKQLIDPDVSIEAYIHHLEAEQSLAIAKEITA